MTDLAFNRFVIAYSKLYLKQHPTHPDAGNIKLYQDPRLVESCLSNYRQILSIASGSVLDVGAGVGFAKQIDRTVYAADREYGFFREVTRRAGLDNDFTLKDCNSYADWINTDQIFNTVIVHRFYPWYGTTIQPKIMVNVLCGIDKVLANNGRLLYSPLQPVPHMGEYDQSIDFPTYNITKQQLQYAIDTYKIL